MFTEKMLSDTAVLAYNLSLLYKLVHIFLIIIMKKLHGIMPLNKLVYYVIIARNAQYTNWYGMVSVPYRLLVIKTFLG